MTLIVVLLGVLAGLAWFLPDDRASRNDEPSPFQDPPNTPDVE
jgi:hypothetical protein